jgi:hypothetical protein
MRVLGTIHPMWTMKRAAPIASVWQEVEDTMRALEH